jgi:hypothetical protein
MLDLTNYYGAGGAGEGMFAQDQANSQLFQEQGGVGQFVDERGRDIGWRDDNSQFVIGDTGAGMMQPIDYSPAGRGTSGNWEATAHDNYDPLNALDYATTRVNSTRGQGNNETKINELSQWMTDVNKVYNNNPEVYNDWAQQNPQEAIRYHAMMGKSQWNGGDNQEEHQQAAQQRAGQYSQDLGYGSDGKMDGKAIASDFDTFNDLTNEGGPGDIWKLGTPNSLPGGINDFVEDNPWKAAGMVALAVAAPYATSALAAAFPTLGTAGSAALVGAASSGIQGGDLEDIVKAAGTAGITSAAITKATDWLGNQEWASDIFKAPEYTLQGPDGNPIIGDDGGLITVSDPDKYGQLPPGVEGTWVPDKTFSMPNIPDPVQDAIDAVFGGGSTVSTGGGGEGDIGDNLPGDLEGTTPPYFPVSIGGSDGGGGGGGSDDTGNTPISQELFGGLPDNTNPANPFIHRPDWALAGFGDWIANPQGLMK